MIAASWLRQMTRKLHLRLQNQFFVFPSPFLPVSKKVGPPQMLQPALATASGRAVLLQPLTCLHSHCAGRSCAAAASAHLSRAADSASSVNARVSPDACSRQTARRADAQLRALVAQAAATPRGGRPMHCGASRAPAMPGVAGENGPQKSSYAYELGDSSVPQSAEQRLEAATAVLQSALPPGSLILGWRVVDCATDTDIGFVREVRGWPVLGLRVAEIQEWSRRLPTAPLKAQAGLA